VLGNALETGEKVEMLLGSELVPENVELGTKSDIFADLVNVVNVLSVDDDLSVIENIRIQDTS
jgi:hypothetical protein